jgi:hypothetical protein
MGAAVRCRSGPPALRVRGRSRARRQSFRGWARTSEGRGQGPAGDADAPPGTGTGGEIRTLKQPGLGRLGIPRFPSRPRRAPPGARTPYRWIKSPVPHPYGSRRGERHAGVEPAFRAWKAGTLAVVLMPHGGSPRTRTSRLLVFPHPLCPMSQRTIVGIAGLEPAASRSRSARSSLLSYIPSAGVVWHTCRPRRNADLKSDALPCPWSRSGPPRIRTGKPSPCKGVALPIGASSPGAARPGTTSSQGRPRGRRFARGWACLVLLVFRCGFVNAQARSPRREVLRMDGRNRTRNHWSWRPALSQVELRP